MKSTRHAGARVRAGCTAKPENQSLEKAQKSGWSGAGNRAVEWPGTAGTAPAGTAIGCFLCTLDPVTRLIGSFFPQAHRVTGFSSVASQRCRELLLLSPPGPECFFNAGPEQGQEVPRAYHFCNRMTLATP